METIARCRRVLAALLCLCALEVPPAAAQPSTDWRENLRARIERIDEASPGTLGVYVKRLGSGEVFSHGAEQRWYLGSTTKLPLAVAVLQQVDAGRLRLDESLVLQEADRIDGAGELVWARPGTRYSVDALLGRMLGVSDNTAANLLLRRIGLEAFNRSARDAMGDADAGPFTNFTQVRQAVYAQLHSDARGLAPHQLVQVAAAPLGPRRVEAVRQALDLPAPALQAKTIDEAYARYYRSGANSASLQAYGRLLERLVRGELLSAQSTQRLFEDLKLGRRGAYRLEAGLPRAWPWIHKTGTQYRRACHVGVIDPQGGRARAVVVATCAADLDDRDEAGAVFRQVGHAIARSLGGAAAMSPK